MAKLVTRKEANSRRIKLLVFAGMFDFLGTVAGLMVIVACLVLIKSLVSWVIADGELSFSTLYNIIVSAIIVPK